MDRATSNGAIATPTRCGRGSVAIALAIVLAGCALKTPPERSQLTTDALANAAIPSAWTAGEAGAAEVGDAWRHLSDDPRLAQLLTEAMTHNADLRLAAARVEEASGYVKMAGGQLYPAVDFLGRATTKDSTDFQGIFLTSSWELDLWGRVRYGVRAAEDQYASARADYEFARASIAALVTKAWMLATEARLQRSLASETLVSADRLVGLVEERQRVGAAAELDVVLARTNAQVLRDSARQIDLAYEQSLRALELLVGRYPSAEIETAPQLAPIPAPPPLGLPAQLLERRPDVIAAERRVAAAFNRTEEARAAMLPTISLTAGLNYIWSSNIVLERRDNPMWSVGGRVLAPLYRGGALEAQVEVRTAEQKQAVAAYGQAALKAFGEVENALSGESALRDRQAILEQAVQGNQRALDLEQTRYRIGERDLRSVTQQQLALYASQMTLLRVQSERRIQRVNLHLALGGSFGEAGGVEAAATSDVKPPRAPAVPQ